MRNPGFTLIELLVVIGLMTLIAAFTIPTYQSILSQEQLSQSTDELIGYLLSIQQQTVTQQKIYGVTFIAGSTTVPQYLYDTTNATKTSQSSFTLAANTQLGAVNFSTQSDVRFSTSAAPNVSGTVEILDTVRGRHKLITISPSGSITANQSEY